MWEQEILGIDFYHVLAWLFIYSVMGWIWESCYVSVKERKLVNRGFVTGPVCTIYGVGAVSVYLILRPLDGKILPLFFCGIALATTLEYLTAVVMEKLFHMSWWDYSSNRFNFQGRICLGSSIVWGFFTVIMFEILQPLVERITGLVDEASGRGGLGAAIVLYAVDFGFSMATAMQLGEKVAQMEQAMSEFSEHLQESRIFTSASELLELLDSYRRNRKYGNIRERLEKYQEMMADRIEKMGIQEQKEAAIEKLRVAVEKLSNLIVKGGWNSRRLIKAYPNLSKASKARERLMRLSRLERKENKEDVKK